MKTQARKAKGRRLQQAIARAIRRVFKLADRDVVSRPMGSGGTDIMLSEKAAKAFPFSVEAKNQERLDLWAAWEQAKANGEELTPLLVVKKNRSDTLAVLDFNTFLEIINERHKR